MKLLLSFIPIFCSATLLSEADALSERYAAEVARMPEPAAKAATERCLERSSTWVALDLNCLQEPKILESKELWGALREVGFDGAYLEHLREGFGINPRWNLDWAQVTTSLRSKNFTLIGDGLGRSTGLGGDFALALQNVGEYPSLYHLIAIREEDWALLPHVAGGEIASNIPWLALQELQRQGYVPECSAPYTKESAWNATGPICGSDGKMRRWIYLKQGWGDPVLAWLAPSLGAERLAAADGLSCVMQWSIGGLAIDAHLPHFAKKMCALWTRKLGAWSAEKMSGGIEGLQQAVGDVVEDIWTRSPLLHALVTEDAEALRLIYRLLLYEKVPLQRLIHTLQPLDAFACDWAEFLAHPRRKYRYWQEQVTAEVLRQRLLREDLLRLEGPFATWANACTKALGYKEADGHREEIAHAHQLLALTYAMQPGVVSISAADLLGALQDEKLDLMGPNENTLYASLPIQLRHPRSFAMQLRHLLEIRRQWNLAKGALLDVPNVCNRGVLLLVQQTDHRTFVLAVNFSKVAAQEAIELAAIRNTHAVELISGLAEKKPFESSQFSFSLSPLSGKVYCFQGKYYE